MANTLDSSAGFLGVDGHAGALRCSGESSGGDGNEHGRRRRRLWREGERSGRLLDVSSEEIGLGAGRQLPVVPTAVAGEVPACLEGRRRM
jgi:hypothetical protein